MNGLFYKDFSSSFFNIPATPTVDLPIKVAPAGVGERPVFVLATSSGIETSQLLVTDSTSVDLDDRLPVFANVTITHPDELGGRVRVSYDGPQQADGHVTVLSWQRTMQDASFWTVISPPNGSFDEPRPGGQTVRPFAGAQVTALQIALESNVWDRAGFRNGAERAVRWLRENPSPTPYLGQGTLLRAVRSVLNIVAL